MQRTTCTMVVSITGYINHDLQDIPPERHTYVQMWGLIEQLIVFTLPACRGVVCSTEWADLSKAESLILKLYVIN